jgi:hypothetical protein
MYSTKYIAYVSILETIRGVTVDKKGVSPAEFEKLSEDLRRKSMEAISVELFPGHQQFHWEFTLWSALSKPSTCS